VLWFTGCITSIVEQSATLDAIYLLNQCGYTVHIPAAQGCCGALLQHEGQDTAFLVHQNQQAFAKEPFAHLPILSLATGCTAQLQETPLHKDTRVWDVMQFLAEKANLVWETLLFQALPATVLLHMPCSQRNVLKDTQSTRQLLQSIPQLTLQSLTSTGCCGAAGLYHLHHPTTAQALRRQQLAQLPNQGERYLLSQNVGCSMWLRGESPVQILHPIRLLAQQHRAAVVKKSSSPI
jgi:glycolate oxidase iron-sulfur subunit